MNWHMNLYFQRVDVKKPLLIKGLIIIIGGAVHPPLWSFIQELGRLVGFGVGAFTHIFTHELFWMAISRVLEADH